MIHWKRETFWHTFQKSHLCKIIDHFEVRSIWNLTLTSGVMILMFLPISTAIHFSIIWCVTLTSIHQRNWLIPECHVTEFYDKTFITVSPIKHILIEKIAPVNSGYPQFRFFLVFNPVTGVDMPNQRYSHYTNPMLHQPGPRLSEIMSPDGVQFHQPIQTQGQYVQTEVQPDTKGLSIFQRKCI